MSQRVFVGNGKNKGSRKPQKTRLLPADPGPLRIRPRSSARSDARTLLCACISALSKEFGMRIDGLVLSLEPRARATLREPVCEHTLRFQSTDNTKAQSMPSTVTSSRAGHLQRVPLRAVIQPASQQRPCQEATTARIVNTPP